MDLKRRERKKKLKIQHESAATKKGNQKKTKSYRESMTVINNHLNSLKLACGKRL